MPTNVTDTQDLVTKFKAQLSDGTDICKLAPLSDSNTPGWTIVASFTACVDIALAISDGRGIYGLSVSLPVLGALDVLYRRVNEQLGIFSAEYTLPAALRTIQTGAVTIRLPTFRIEIHTDGGFLVDLGYPWGYDFSRSAQVEFAIFLGSAGFYYGYTAAAASDLLAFPGDSRFLAPNWPDFKNKTGLDMRALRIGFAARAGIGRSFSIGILNAEASLTIFGGLEGAAAFPSGHVDLLSPTLYALKGFVGLMLDIRATVSFSIIQASARLTAYALVGIEIQRVLAMDNAGAYYYLTLPIVIFAEVGLTVSVDVQISIGCVTVTIHLSFSTTWRIQETLGNLDITKVFPPGLQSFDAALESAPAPLSWSPAYRAFKEVRDLNLFVTVLPCLASPADVGEGGAVPVTCIIGQMLLPVNAASNGFADFARFLVGWALRPDSTVGVGDSDAITLGEVKGRRQEINDLVNDPNSAGVFWSVFQPALVTVLGNQFRTVLNVLQKDHTDDPFAALPLWPSAVFSYVPAAPAPVITATPVAVAEGNSKAGKKLQLSGDAAAFANYSVCVILGMLAEIEQTIRQPDATKPPTEDPAASRTWAQIGSDLLTL